MLFNSYIFIFVFLPITLLGFHLIGRRGYYQLAIAWLVGASLFFYGWWNPVYLWLIFVSITFNYAVGLFLQDRPSKIVLTVGIFVNLGLLGYFKYANFFVDSVSIAFDQNIHFEDIILPLAISFYTFQQITYLVDAYRGLVKEYNFLHYCLFVTFFPQLIAGPIVHHKEMLPQFSNSMLSRLRASHLAVGFAIFSLGLFKKVVLADNIAIYATPVFDAAENDIELSFFESWGGALAYSFQLYFDFSGYSDMAIGLARMFGVVLAVNFYSPYKANSIIEFWRRWHITLSRFLRDYLYIPLGGNKKGNFRRYVNLLITMLLGGLWHGAGWTFVVWGGLHGLYLVINHGWNVFVKAVFPNRSGVVLLHRYVGRMLTFIAVVISWVIFRAESLGGAMVMYSAMFGFNGVSLPVRFETYLGEFGAAIGFVYNGMFHNGVFGDWKEGLIFLFILFLISWFAPNTSEILRNHNPALNLKGFLPETKGRFVWRPTFVSAFVLALLAVISLMYIQQESEFLYFQF